jgi:hypothetical protein
MVGFDIKKICKRLAVEIFCCKLKYALIKVSLSSKTENKQIRRLLKTLNYDIGFAILWQFKVFLAVQRLD